MSKEEDMSGTQQLVAILLGEGLATVVAIAYIGARWGRRS